MLGYLRVLETALRPARLVVVACGLCWLNAATADGVVSVNQPWARPGVRASEAYMIIESSEGGTLRAVLCAAADRVDLLSGSRRVATLELPAGAPVVFRPKGNRLALFGLAHPFKLGDRVPLTLIIESGAGTRREIVVDAEVRRESPAEAELRAHRH